MRKIGVVTVGRSDYGIYLPLLRAIQADPQLELRLIVGGMHLDPRYGQTEQMIAADGLPVAARVESLPRDDSAAAVAEAIGLGVAGFARALPQAAPDLLVVLGDRYEMFAAALAALPLNLPVAHIHGGELTFGAMDDALRHAMTKLSHLHFVSTEAYARRVIQMGEQPWRVTVSGAPGLDHLDSLDLLDRPALEARLGLGLDKPTVLVTFHPVTLEPGQAASQSAELLAALAESGLQAVFTLPNADMGNAQIREQVTAFVQARPGAVVLVDNLGTRAYFSLMACAAAMLGNSSSGIIEAASFGLPVVNVGSRQAGRVRAANVIDVECLSGQILPALRRAVSADFRASLAGLQNPYRRGNASALILQRLKSVSLDARLLTNVFADLPAAQGVAP